MKWKARDTILKFRHYEIQYDPLVGFYLYVFEGKKCIRDYLQDSLDLAMECTLKDFGVPKDLWEKIGDEE
jgi:hypothetical protein